MNSFQITRLPELRFGAGGSSQLSQILQDRSLKNIALILGGRSFKQSPAYDRLIESLKKAHIRYTEFSVVGEPSPETVDSIVATLKAVKDQSRTEGVVAIGGGSVIDTGKAVAALYTMEGSVQEYLEGVGTRKPLGTRLPLIAIPTTSGTGAEATKNAVISRIGPSGFKKSLRHDNFVPDVAILDPELTISCPPEVTAASGLDAITQLLEAYTCTRANPFTDGLSLKALELAGKGFLTAYRDGRNLVARSQMAYAAYISGVCLAQAGLGVVHGIASPMGGLFPIPHGIVCGSLVVSATRFTVSRAMRMDDPSEDSVLKRYARAGMALSGKDAGSDNGNAALLIKTLERFSTETKMPLLRELGLKESDLSMIASKTEAKYHPIPLTVQDIETILKDRY
ncbi:MAG: iron-containing alcohol dehydrogenase [Spirochaetes bacterium]|nr:iron-containing alcohol dehydrogenase [Spirochaetota bacterium]